MHRYAVSSYSHYFLAGMVEISSSHDTASVQMAEQEFWGKGKTLSRTVFYGGAALREITKDELMSAEGMVSLNMCAYVSGFMILIL